jgi:hypothetical protein
MKMRRLITNDASITPLPIIPAKPLDNCFLHSPLIRNPTSGKTGISQASSKILLIKPKPLGAFTPAILKTAEHVKNYFIIASIKVSVETGMVNSSTCSGN